MGQNWQDTEIRDDGTSGPMTTARLYLAVHPRRQDRVAHEIERILRARRIPDDADCLVAASTAIKDELPRVAPELVDVLDWVARVLYNVAELRELRSDQSMTLPASGAA